MQAIGHPTLEADAPARRSVWLAYAGLCFLGWVLFGVAGTEWRRGDWNLWSALYEATWNLGPPMLLGALVYPWALWLRRRGGGIALTTLWHALAALTFAAGCHALDFGLQQVFFGSNHAQATLQQNLLWRSAVAVFLYVALFLGFNGVIDARRAQDAAMSAAQAEAALVRAELAAISGKLNPHFLFNTLNTISHLVRKDARAAEQALHCFSRMMRYLLDAKRGAADRVLLRDELGFVRDYLELESLRLGARLKVEWAVNEATLDDAVPPLTLQPLVENSVLHGVAPRVAGGTVRVQAERQDSTEGLLLRVSDDGPGCEWPTTSSESNGVGLAALQRRFQVDFGGRSRLSVRSAPGAGFHVEIFIPQNS
jgi:signal transduction histidine kinase